MPTPAIAGTTANTLAELLTGWSYEHAAGKEFAGEMHARLLPGDTLTLAPTKGQASRYQWDAGEKVYVLGR